MWKSLLKASYGILTHNAAINREKNYLARQNKLQREYVKESMDKAASQFNRIYYRNYLDTPAAANMLKQMRDQLLEQTRALRGASVVIGTAEPRVAAVQSANNKELSRVVGVLSAADTRQKERAVTNYENVWQKLSDSLYAGASEYYRKKMTLENERYAGVDRILKQML